MHTTLLNWESKIKFERVEILKFFKCFKTTLAGKQKHKLCGEGLLKQLKPGAWWVTPAGNIPGEEKMKKQILSALETYYAI